MLWRGPCLVKWSWRFRCRRRCAPRWRGLPASAAMPSRRAQSSSFLCELCSRRRAFSGAQLVAARGWAYTASSVRSVTKSSDKCGQYCDAAAALAMLVSYSALASGVCRISSIHTKASTNTSIDTEQLHLSRLFRAFHSGDARALCPHTHRLDDGRGRSAGKRLTHIKRSREARERYGRWRGGAPSPY